MPFNGLLDLFGAFVNLFVGKSKTTILFDTLKADPKNEAVAQQIKDQFVDDPLSVIREVLQRAKGVKEVAPTLKADPYAIVRQTWKNTIKKQEVQPLQYLRPETKQDLINIIIQAEASGLLVRAVGAGHSFSDVSNATDFLVDMLKLNNTLPVETDTLKPNLPTLFNAQAGMMVQKINSELDKLGLALPTMAAFDQETIYGAIATSTHGTGLNVDGMAAMVRSMDIVTSGGKCYRVEPKDGITDKLKFKVKYPNNEIELVQDDDRFYSAVVGFGLMGIVYSIVIVPVKTFYLKQRLWITTWDEVKPRLLDRTFFHAIDPQWKQVDKIPGTDDYPATRAQVFVNPYVTKNFITKKNQHTCAVQIQTEISKAEYDILNAQVTKHPENKILALLISILSDGSLGDHEESIKAEDANVLTEEISTVVLLQLLNDFPLLTPLFLDISLVVLLSGSGKFGKGYDVMNQGKLAIKNAGYSVEPGFAVDEKNSFVAGAEEILRIAALSQVSTSFLTSPICMRFVKGSKDYMSPEYKTNTCMIDVPLMLGTIGDDQMLDRMQLNLIEIGARPHWGKICNLVNGEELIDIMYPEFDAFLKAVAFFNPKGTFNSTFSYRTGISKMVYKRD
jgi:hypothetical protein